MFFGLIFIFILSALYVYKRRKDKEGLPPGDDGWPLIGNIFLSPDSLVKHVNVLRKKHGEIFRSQLGSRTVIYLASDEIIKTALAKPELSDRPDSLSFRILSIYENYGVAFSNGHIWQNNRRFTLRHLKDFGMGKTRLESTIMFEINQLIKHFNQTLDRPTTIDKGIDIAVVNIIWTLTAGRRYEIDDQELHDLTSFLETSLELVTGPFALLDIYPILETILPNILQNKLMKVDKVYKIMGEITSFLKKVIDEHVENFDSSNPKDFIDMYLLELQREKDTKEESYMQDLKNLSATIFNIFAGGSDTTSVTIKFLILYLAAYPDVQMKVHEELDRVVNGSRLPDMEDKINLPYMVAVVHEIGRKISLAALGVLHRANVDTTVKGYKIPKGAWISTCIEECHNDPNYFEHPDEFYPEHFLDSDGKLISNKKGYLPWANGKRVCLGESLAKMELYLFAGGLLKEFEFSAPPGVTYDLTPHRTAIISYPKPFEVIIKRRLNKT